jgi:hypothetical protein
VPVTFRGEDINLSGRFAVRGCRLATSLVTAVDLLDKGMGRDVATLERLRRLSKRVTLAAGQVRQQQLRLTSLR